MPKTKTDEMFAYTNRIKFFRTAFGLTQKELGEYLDLSYESVRTDESRVEVDRATNQKKMYHYVDAFQNYCMEKEEIVIDLEPSDLFYRVLKRKESID